MAIPSLDNMVQKPIGNLLSAIFLVFMLVVGADVLSMFIGLLMPRVEWRESRCQMQCTQNLKQIGLAIQVYHQTYGCFPPSFIPDKKGKPMHSWRVMLLPFLGERDLYARYRLDEPWNSPHNIALAGQMPAVYRCPSEAPSCSQTSYVMIVGPRAVSDGPTARRSSDIRNGGTNTIIVAETANAGITWLQPIDLNTENTALRADAANSREPSGRRDFDISSWHDGKINVLLCDGTVRTVNKGVDENALKAMLTIDGGNAVKR